MEKLGINLLRNSESVALIVKNNERIDKISYRDLQKQVLKVDVFIESIEGIQKNSTIGIYGDKSYTLIAITLGIIESNFSFCYIAKEDVKNAEFDVEYFFSLAQINSNAVRLNKTLILCGTNVYFYKSKIVKQYKKFNFIDNEMNKVCYRITTSGTTGKRKLIHVTYNSIYPNIKSLDQIFKLCQSDVIFSASPITFDVFIADLFLALYSGASLLLITDNHRFDMSVYSKESAASVTFLQMTPTIFKQYGLENIQSKILHSQSSLKHLVLGGEEFPSTKEVLTWQNWNQNDRKRIFNIYGVTEMSCWALIHEVTKEDLEYGKVPLGSPLDKDTIPAYYPQSDDIEELILTTSSRVNFFEDNEWDKKLGTEGVFAYKTNDLVRKINGKIYWYGRSNDIVKRFGERVDLKKIEDLAAEIIRPVACIMIKKRIALFYQSSDVTQLLSNHLRNRLKKSEYPDDIKRIDFLPTCDHGKVSKNKLKELYKDILKEDQSKQSAEEIFLETINQMFNLKLEKPAEMIDGDQHDGKRMKCDIDSTFQQIGGSSFDALRIAMKIEDKMNANSNALLTKLLDTQYTIKDAFSYLKSLNLNVKNGSAIKSFDGNSLIDVKIDKKFDLQKCVDSTASKIVIDNESFVAIGCHSGDFIVFSAKDLSVVSKLNLNDRIECEAAQFRNDLVVGCYDGFLYGIDFLNNRVKFKYNSGAMIKSKPLVINNELIIIGNYNSEKNVACLSADETAELKWSKMVGMAGILANIFNIDDDSCIVCTLDGTIEKLRINDGSTVWNKKFEYPIFSSPQKLDKMKAIVFAEVMRKVNCVDYDGNVLWNFETDGHIFSSFLYNYFNDNSVKLIFGCHDNKLRCLHFSKSESKVSLEWSVELQSQIYGTPKMIEINGSKYLISCSTSGYVNLISFLSGKIEKVLKLPGEVFSSPLVHNNKIFIGCRDNFVYCLSLNHQ